MKLERARIVVCGAVQGVGFRPFVYRLATSLGLCGSVSNTPQGVVIEVEGRRATLNDFLRALETDPPPRAEVRSLEFAFVEPLGFERFEISSSANTGPKTALILPDIATCADCLDELVDPTDRRHLYPFINCTNCGPRFSIIESLPYDRPNTSMKAFRMCGRCEEEYLDPSNRRFHAQPNACPNCGPQLSFWKPSGIVVAEKQDALFAAIQAIKSGSIVAIKGLGGFQLVVDARDDDAVRRLRKRKHREEKPFALMFPSLETLRRHCRVDDLEARLVQSPEAPIVLLEKAAAASDLAASVAPNNPCLGAMLPYSPLHHALLWHLGFPIVATSGNLSDEPICIDNEEARKRLEGIADFFLVHNRPVVRPVDDSVARVVLGRELLLRRARGYAPLPVQADVASQPCVLAVGAHLKNTVALKAGRNIFISQHIGDLGTTEALKSFRSVAADLPRLAEARPEAVACDLHPEYLSTVHARERGWPVIPVQHHYAHLASCMAENEIEAPALGIVWDGTGYGLDGTIWGGEFLIADKPGGDLNPSAPFTRFAHFRNFRLPGGPAAIRQPRRTALSLLWELFGNEAFNRTNLIPVKQFSSAEQYLLRQMLRQQVNCPVTCSVGRLFDAVAALLGLRQWTTFEGQAAMDLEFAVDPDVADHYSFEIQSGPPAIVDWRPMILELLEDLRAGRPIGASAARFHNTLVEIAVAIALRAGIPKVVLTGGCFQNKILLERLVKRLQVEGVRPYWHQWVPPNDGGISFGQAVAAAELLEEQRSRAAEPAFRGNSSETETPPLTAAHF